MPEWGGEKEGFRGKQSEQLFVDTPTAGQIERQKNTEGKIRLDRGARGEKDLRLQKLWPQE